MKCNYKIERIRPARFLRDRKHVLRGAVAKQPWESPQQNFELGRRALFETKTMFYEIGRLATAGFPGDAILNRAALGNVAAVITNHIINSPPLFYSKLLTFLLLLTLYVLFGRTVI